jgi:2-oxoisovalerate dehydrogenase E1 component
MTLRLTGHAAYDNAEYVSEEERKQWLPREPLPKVRRKLSEISGFSENDIVSMEHEIGSEVERAVRDALAVGRPDPSTQRWDVYAAAPARQCKPFSAKNVKNVMAVNMALETILAENPRAFLLGQDIGVYGSAFKTCKGLLEKFGRDRVIDMPICESATIGFALGATQAEGLPIIEFQFADFGTEAVTSLGLNSATWYFRTGRGAPILVRMPCGGGITLGAFHSGEFDGLWTRFPGLKILYPTTPQETFEALVAGFYDPNPCIVLEHKRLYVGSGGDIEFDGNLERIWKARRYTEGNELTLVATGGAVLSALKAIEKSRHSVEVWNPFVLQPLELGPIIESVNRTGRLLVVQESGRTAGLADKIVSIICRECFAKLTSQPRVIAAPDMPVPFAPELETFYIPNSDTIHAHIEQMIGVLCEH